MRSKLLMIIGGIVGASLLAFLCGMLLTIMVIMPAREPVLERASVTVEPIIGPHVGRTPEQPSPTPIPVGLILTPQPPGPTPTAAVPGATSTPVPSIATTPTQRPTLAPSPTPTSRFPFYYVEGSRIEEENCFSQYLQGWVQDASGAPVNGITVRYHYWNNIDVAISGDPQKVWRPGEFKFDYMPENPHVETDFVFEIVSTAEHPEPQSEPLVMHYAGCGQAGQITNIVFRQR